MLVKVPLRRYRGDVGAPFVLQRKPSRTSCSSNLSRSAPTSPVALIAGSGELEVGPPAAPTIKGVGCVKRYAELAFMDNLE